MLHVILKSPMKPIDLTDKEIDAIRQDTCPDCNTKGLYEGPSQSCAINCICPNCGAKFNIGFGDAERLSFPPPESEKEQVITHFKSLTDKDFEGNYMWIGP